MSKNPGNTGTKAFVVAVSFVVIAFTPALAFGETAEIPPTGEISLTAAIEEALQGNPQLAAGRAQIRNAEAGVWAARSSLLPDVVTIGDYTRSEEPSLVNPMHGTPSPMDPLVFDEEIYTASIRLDVPILNLSALSGVGAAKHGVEVQRARSAEAEQAIIAGVMEIFVQAGQLNDNLTLIDGHLRALERRHTELQLLSRGGRVSPAAVAEVEASLDSVRADRLELLRRRNELGYRLGGILGRREIVLPRAEAFVLPSMEEKPSRLGPAAHAAEAQLAAAEAGRAGALSSFAPQLNGFATQTARSGSDIDFNAEWSIGLQLTFPLATGGERIARFRSADAGVEAAQYNRDAVVTDQLNEAQILLRRWENAEARRGLLAKAVLNQERSVAAADSRYAEGRASLSDLLAAEATLLELNMNERSTKYDQLLSYIAYQKLAGGLSQSLAQTLIEE